MHDEHSEQQHPYVIQQSPPPRRRFFGPFTCCLGCGGMLVVVVALVAGVLWWMVTRALESEPFRFEVPPVAAGAAASAQAKADRIEGAGAGAAVFTAQEVNGLIQKAIAQQPARAGEEPPRASVEFLPGDKVALKLSTPLDMDVGGVVNLGTRYLNIDYVGRVTVENGKITLSDVEKARVGKFDKSQGADKLLATLQDYVRDFAGKYAKDGRDPLAGLDRVERLEVRDGKLFFTLSPALPPVPAEESAPPPK